MSASTGVGTATTKNVRSCRSAGSELSFSGVVLDARIGLARAIVAVAELLDLRLIDVEADRALELAGERKRDGQADVPETDHGDLLFHLHYPSPTGSAIGVDGSCWYASSG